MTVMFGGDDITNLFPTSTSTQQSGSSNSSKSGINWDSPFMKQLYPTITKAAADLPGLAASMGDTIQGQYSNLMRQGMGPNAFTGTLNSLAGRGMLNSNIASNAIASTGQGIAQNIGNQAFNSMLAGQNAQMQVPGLLAQLANLGQETKSSGGSYSNSKSVSSNPLAPYELMSGLITS